MACRALGRGDDGTAKLHGSDSPRVDTGMDRRAEHRRHRIVEPGLASGVGCRNATADCWECDCRKIDCTLGGTRGFGTTTVWC